MQFIHDHDFSNSIDIFKTVVEMRKCRRYMVQTEVYILLYYIVIQLGTRLSKFVHLFLKLS